MTEELARIKIQQIIRDLDSLSEVSKDFATEDAREEFLYEIESAVVSLDALEDLIDGDAALKDALKQL